MTTLIEYIKRITRYAHTLRHLNPLQVVFYVLRRGLPPITVRSPVCASMREGLRLQPLLSVSTFQETERQASFCNQVIQFDAGIDWNPVSQSLLWRYHLHYFDQLRDHRRSSKNKNHLIDDWIDKNPQNTRPAWEPYTVSLRIVNWVAYMLSDESPHPLPQSWLNSLYEQASWLEKNDERHILANHYFKNVKALIFAGVLFRGDDAERWMCNWQKILMRQLSEQFLKDGGHYERAPHYHILMMEDLLDLINLSKSNPGILKSETEMEIKETAQCGMAFLNRIAMPDYSIPLFNDSIYNAAPTVKELNVYADRLLDRSVLNGSNGPVLIDESESGIYGFRNGLDMMVIDCGDIGPDYQPGHTHCDFLNFELMLDGMHFIVDSGVYEYQAGKMRDYARSTAAHNTLTVDMQNQTEVWGEFRVGRRAKKIGSSIKRDGNKIEFSGCFRGFPQVSGSIIHNRAISINLADNTYVIYDEIFGNSAHRIDSYLHFHPDIVLIDEGCGCWKAMKGNKAVANILVVELDNNGVTSRIESGWYCPEFGLKYANNVFAMTLEADLPVKLCCRIEKIN